MPRKSTIQNERYCRSKVYGVYSTYSLRRYYKKNTREVDHVLSFMRYLGEEREKLQIFKCDVDPCSPHLGALKSSLSLDLGGGERKSPWGDVRERGEATGGRKGDGQHGEAVKTENTAVKRVFIP
jgi:hypothetical protein